MYVGGGILLQILPQILLQIWRIDLYADYPIHEEICIPQLVSLGALGKFDAWYMMLNTCIHSSNMCTNHTNALNFVSLLMSIVSCLQSVDTVSMVFHKQYFLPNTAH